MSKVNFPFIMIPRYFFDKGWLTLEKPEQYAKRLSFLLWSFGKCKSIPHREYHDHREILLQPYEFICGRNSVSKETLMTPQEVRGFINQLICVEGGGTLEKTTNSVTNRFTCYRWVTSSFEEFKNQLKSQPTTNRQPTDNHKQEIIYNRLDTTTPNPIAVVASFEFLKKLKLNPQEIEAAMQFSEERLKLAVDYMLHPDFVPKKSEIAALIWHCKQKFPPVHAEKTHSEQQRLAWAHVEFMKKNGFSEYAYEEENRVSIPKGVLHLWDNQKTMIVLKELNLIKKDLEESINACEATKRKKQKA